MVINLFLGGCAYSIHSPFSKTSSCIDRSGRYDRVSAPMTGQDASSSRPVYILPVITKHYVHPHTDTGTGEWIGGYTSATVVEQGKFATQEEAEHLGKKYITPDNNAFPTVPMPSNGQELNATTLAQKLASFNDTSLNNQIAGGHISSLPPNEKLKSVKETSSGNIKVNFIVAKNALRIFPGGSDGDSFSVVTPKGPAKLKYDNGLVIIEFRGQEQSVKQPSEGPVIVLLPFS